MKTLPKILAALLFLAASCNVPKNLTSNNSYHDDIYYSPSDAPAANTTASTTTAANNQQQAVNNGSQNNTSANNQEQDRFSDNVAPNTDQSSGQTADASNTQRTTDQNGNTYVNNNYYGNSGFDMDDYYDYAYAARIRRFDDPWCGYGYYNDYYTNTYWYDYNPYHWGMSIYLGYDWWGPSYYTYSYDPMITWGYYGMGYYSPWYCNNWGWQNHYPYGWGYGGYWNAYNHGYGNGYYDNGWGGYGYNNYYYNSYDNNSYYYGPRGSVSSNGKVKSGSSFAQRYQRAVAIQQKENPKTFLAGRGPDNSSQALHVVSSYHPENKGAVKLSSGRSVKETKTMTPVKLNNAAKTPVQHSTMSAKPNVIKTPATKRVVTKSQNYTSSPSTNYYQAQPKKKQYKQQKAKSSNWNGGSNMHYQSRPVHKTRSTHSRTPHQRYNNSPQRHSQHSSPSPRTYRRSSSGSSFHGWGGSGGHSSGSSRSSGRSYSPRGHR